MIMPNINPLLFRTTFIALFISSFLSLSTVAQVQVGAYYFGGWSEKIPNHITPALKNEFKDREPIWGYITNTQKIVDEQIVQAANAGLSFFSFCWYYYHEKRYNDRELNMPITRYLQSPYKNKLKFCFMVANHGEVKIGPVQFPIVKDLWLNAFKDPQYLQVNGKPLLIFFEFYSLLKEFGSAPKIRAAFDDLRAEAVRAGLKGVTIAICAGPQEEIKKLEESGFDLITGYNYHSSGFARGVQANPITNMQQAEQKIWSTFPKLTKIPYMPVVTLGWDPRPWSNDGNKYLEKPYYKGYSANSVMKSVSNGIRWINKNSHNTTKEKILLLYAWNENGEGAWLTPGKTGFTPLKGVTRALGLKSVN
ncbi:glycoside hydrolase family 99-like domain-containing protein [Olivibacter jilunii]